MEQPLSTEQIKERLRAAHTRKAQALTILLSKPSPVSICQQAEIDRQEASNELEYLWDLQCSISALADLEI